MSETVQQQQQQQLRVAYAIPPKKEQTLIQPSLLDHAARQGLRFIRIDPAVPLSQQHRGQEGPFHCIVHKLNGQDWKTQLQLFSIDHPDVPIIDPLDCIDPLHNRLTMLQVVRQINIHSNQVSFGAPNQVIVDNPEDLKQGVGEEVGFPVIAKPLVADGSAGSHEMHVVFTAKGLEKLRAPVALQEFVNHGGVVFKVYVVGEYVQCVKRPSLPDISSPGEEDEDPMPFSQISNIAASAADKNVELEMQMPPLSFVKELASEMRKMMGLRLFNFDLIKDGRSDGERYLVIDINYFPGYAKIPGYESILTDFFKDVIVSSRQQQKH